MEKDKPGGVSSIRSFRQLTMFIKRNVNWDALGGSLLTFAIISQVFIVAFLQLFPRNQDSDTRNISTGSIQNSPSASETNSIPPSVSQKMNG